MTQNHTPPTHVRVTPAELRRLEQGLSMRMTLGVEVMRDAELVAYAMRGTLRVELTVRVLECRESGFGWWADVEAVT